MRQFIVDGGYGVILQLGLIPLVLVGYGAALHYCKRLGKPMSLSIIAGTALFPWFPTAGIYAIGYSAIIEVAREAVDDQTHREFKRRALEILNQSLYIPAALTMIGLVVGFLVVRKLRRS